MSNTKQRALFRSAPFRNAGQGGPPLPVPSEAQPAAEHDERSARVWLWIRRTVALRRRVEWTGSGLLKMKAAFINWE